MSGRPDPTSARSGQRRPIRGSSRSRRKRRGGYLRFSLQLAAAATLTRFHFGGEDPLESSDNFDNWHHRGISSEAAIATGWSVETAKEVSWHADYVDSYLYNPLWWVQGGLDRIKVALSLEPVLVNVHFDDLTSLAQVQIMWRRYLSGTVAGVGLAHDSGGRKADKVAAARHVVGVALHAVQDFYSHSSWVDEEARRDRLWSHLSPEEQSTVPIFTGSYAHPEHTGIKHHGKYSIGCTIMQPFSGFMDVICHAVSPFSNSSVCEIWRSCEDAEPLTSFEVSGVPIPANVVYLDPPGIALDSTWLAEIGAQERGMSRSDGQMLFDAARSLAVRESMVFLNTVGATMAEAGYGQFWQEIKTAPVSPTSLWEAQFEDFHRQGLHFIGTGTYPPEPSTPEHEWFLRLRIRTADVHGGGTDADILAGTVFGETLLDTMAGRNPLIAYNDFETGDDQVYHIGPFPRLPPTLSLRNDASTIGEVFEALGRAFLEALEGALEATADFFLSLIGGHADHVATNKIVWTPGQLSRLSSNHTPFRIVLDGRSEGLYTVHGTIRRLRRNAAGGRPVSDYAVHLNRLHCIRESEWDRGSNSDEPFFFAMLINQAARTADSAQFGPYEDVDDGDDRSLDHTFVARNVPDGVGHLTLPIQLMESDDEGSGRRRRAFNEFKSVFQTRTAEPRDGFIETLGRALGPDWNVEAFEVDAYRTGEDEVLFGRVLQRVSPGWIRGEQTRRFTLDGSDLQTVEIKRMSEGSDGYEPAFSHTLL